MSKTKYSLKATNEDRIVEITTENDCMTLDEFFYLWVDLAAGCGFAIDKVEMEDMWDGAGLRADSPVDGEFTKWLESIENDERVWDTIMDEFYEVKDLNKLKRWLNKAYEAGRHWLR